MESRNVEVDGIRMRWEERGEGPPVVFVHGIPASPRLWRHVIPRVRGARSMAWPENNVTVVTGDGGTIVSVRKGKPRPDQMPDS